MATQLQIRRGTSAQVAAFTGAEGEIVVNTTNDSVHVSDGSTAGGFELARVDGSNWAITNAISTTANISFGDNDKAIFGAGSDLQIYHSGSASIIEDTGTGDLVIKGTDLYLRNASNSNRLYAGTDTRLYYDGNEKIRTTSTGIDVTGTATMDGLQVTNAATTGTNQEVASFRTASGGGLVIRSSDLSSANPDSILEPFFGESLKIKTSGNDRFKIQDNGDISFYEDTGTTPKLFWDASAESLGIGTSSPSRKLTIQGGSGDTLPVRVIGGSGTTTGGIEFQDASTTADYKVQIGSIGDALYLRAGGAERMRIDSSGNALFGTTNTAPYATSTTGGMVFRNDFDLLGLSRGSNYALSVNRYGTDGDLVNFRKNGTTVGSIGVALSDNLYFSGVDAGIGCGTGSIYPASTTGQPSDNDTDLGTSGTRFKDLRLSGTAYVATSVGIGLTGPDEALEVSGDIKSSGSGFGIYHFGDTSDQTKIVGRDGSHASLPNTMEFYTNSALRATFDSSGRLGIGTSSLSSKLAIHGSAGDAYFKQTNSANSQTLEIGNAFSLYSGASGGVSAIASDSVLAFATADTERLRIDSSGRVGIGTSAPTKTLVVNEDDSECVVVIKSSDTGSAGVYLGGQSDEIKAGMILDNSTNALIFRGYNNAERMRIDSSGRVGIGVSAPSRQLHVSSGTTNEVARFESTDSTAYLSIMDSSTSHALQGIGSVGNDLTLYSNNAERLRIDNEGNVLVGTTTSPTHAKAVKYGVGVQGGSLTVKTAKTAGVTSDVINMSSATSGNIGAGMYLVSIVREGASYGSHHVGIYGVNSSSITLYETLRANGITVSVSGTTIRANTTTTDHYNCNVIPLTIEG